MRLLFCSWLADVLLVARNKLYVLHTALRGPFQNSSCLAISIKQRVGCEHVNIHHDSTLPS